MNREPIQLFVPKFRIEESLEAVRARLERAWTGLGFMTLHLQDRWTE